ncbi:glycosyltransferase family 4 protein [Peptostreptococcaceae bacterium OttesenSCG-928-C18]|nr:glycosyltransferase family 4 protein [Peptostreptococcaceae bacterium OttesenSCG-928-C18]
MKILISTDAYTPMVNGVVTSVKNLKNELTKLGHEVRVLALSQTRHSYKDDDATYMGSIDFSKIYPTARVSLKYSHPLIEDLLAWKPDIIHTQSEFTTFTISKRIASKLDIPIVHTYHTLYEEYTHYFSPSKTAGKFIVRKLTRNIYKKSNAMIVPTKKTEYVLNSYDLKDHIYIVPTGLSMDKFSFKYDEEELAILREELNIPLESKVLVTVGRVGKEKNIEELIDFLNIIDNKNIVLVIIGDGPNREFLEKIVYELGLKNNIIFAGMIPNEQINIYYQMADLFVSASTSETQGLTYIEALANGVPILCRDDLCLEQTVVNDYNGYRYKNYDEFKLYLEKMLTDNIFYNDLAKNAEINVRENFSSEAFANKVLAIYERHVNKKYI